MAKQKPKRKTRTARIWQVTCIDTCSGPRDCCSVYLFPEGTTRKQVLDELWQDWVLGPYNEDLAAGDEGLANPGEKASWEGLSEHAGDWLFELDERRIKVWS